MEALVIAVVGVIVVALATALGPRIGIAGPLALVAIALVIWLVVGLALSRLTFRWIRRDA